MSRIVLPQKQTGETLLINFNFLSTLGATDTVSSASCTASVYSGTDASPTAIISGSASISTPVVTQKITGGVSGVTYLVTCTAITAAGASLQMSGFLTVLPAYL